uniref:Larval cuticle protein A1A-like n=1 Tax=Diabrotica virgifera virgifera TaxID=50390 RepID=A0A6P7GXJ7_DIAVI
MVFKVVTLTLLVACAQAIRYDGHAATSSIVFNDNHNSVQHIQSAHPAPSHGYAAPIAHYSAPSSVSHYAAPAPVAQYAAPAPVAHYAAPAIKVAAPVLLKSSGPSHGASSYSSLSFGSDNGYYNQHSAPVAHYAAPAAKIAAPLLIKAPAKVAVAPVAYAQVAPAYNHGGYSHGGYSHHEEEYAHPKYEFAYGVEDHHTGDIHSHKEVRDGDVTHGEYSLHEADGTVRTVKYSVDKHSGFNAVVERSGHANHAQPTKVILKAVAPAPSYYH